MRPKTSDISLGFNRSAALSINSITEAQRTNFSLGNDTKFGGNEYCDPDDY